MRFIKEHKGIIASVLVFLILTVLVIFSYKNADKQGSLFSVVTQTVVKIDEPVYAVTDKIKNVVFGIFTIGEIKKENEELKKKIAELEKTVIAEKMRESELVELRELSNALNYEHIQKSENYVSADIVAMDNSNIFSRFTINVGKENGVFENTVVVNGDGLVGRIAVSENGYSKVVSIIDELNSVSFMVQRDMSIIGIVRGNGKGSLDGFTIDGKAEIIKGDVIVTSGMGMYPAGIKIGKISKVKYSHDTQLKTVEVNTSVNFKKIQKVLVAQ
ncbi:MAG: rod shape-determining protein MreC [Eubacteriales bacterium]